MKHIEFSKILATATMIIFSTVLLFCLYIMMLLIMSGNSNVYDYAVLTGAMTVTGGLFGTTIKHYYSKAGLQNVAQIRKGTYREIMEVRLKYEEELLKLQNKYNVSKETIEEIDYDSPFKEMSESVLSHTSSKIDEVENINEQEPEINI